VAANQAAAAALTAALAKKNSIHKSNSHRSNSFSKTGSPLKAQYAEQHVGGGGENLDDAVDSDTNDYDELVVVGGKTTKAQFTKQQEAYRQQQLHQNHSTTNGGGSGGKKSMDLEDFNLLKVIGRGSYAKVFLVEYKRNSKLYAMKVGFCFYS
jgi:hypothetical protein